MFVCKGKKIGLDKYYPEVRGGYLLAENYSLVIFVSLLLISFLKFPQWIFYLGNKKQNDTCLFF